MTTKLGLRLTRYTVRGTGEETSCDFCGCPLYNGDEAFEDDSGQTRGAIYCSGACADRDVKLGMGIIKDPAFHDPRLKRSLAL